MTARVDWPSITAALVERSFGRCEVCWEPLPMDDAERHHRRPRGMGGTSRDDVHSLSNLLLIHRECHRRTESRRDEAFRDGLLVRQTDDPATIPVRIGGRRWVLLQPDGGYFDVEATWFPEQRPTRVGELGGE